MRGIVLVEDSRTASFVRALLGELGFEVRGFRFEVSPKGEGAAEAWVRTRYPREVRALRSRNYQDGLCVIAVRDGDSVGIAGRKGEMDAELNRAQLAVRAPTERIALPVPTWSIETWLLGLTGQQVVETVSLKAAFAPKDERKALPDASRAWQATACALSSLVDARSELRRLE